MLAPVTKSILRDPDVSQVFRYLSRSRELTKNPQTAQWAATHLRDLGVYLGLEHRLLTGCLRRGAAYLLAINCSEEERTARMGHKDRDSVYWSHYRNEDLTNDFQAIVHAVEAENLEIMGSITLNRKENAPTYPSNGGLFEAFQDPELINLLEEKSELYDQIVQQYHSINKAKDLDPCLFNKHHMAVNKVQACRKRLLSTQFRKELHQFFQQDTEVAQIAVQETKDSPESALSTFAFPLDPALGGTPLPSSIAFLGSQLDSEIQSSAFGIFGAASTFLEPPSNNIEKHRNLLMNVTSVDKAAVLLCGTSCDVQDAELMNLMVQCYSGLHPSDMFHPDTEPLPGSYLCRFCGLDLHAVERSGYHTFQCYKKEFLQSLANRLNEQYPIFKCTAMILRSDVDLRVKKRVDEAVQECGTILDGSTEKSTEKAIYHARIHLESLFPNKNGISVKCTFGGCYESQTPFQSEHYSAHVQHLFFAHCIRVEGYRAKTLDCQFTHLFWWCPFCQRFVLQEEEDINHHILNHIPAYDKAFRRQGYYAISQDHLNVWPILCPVCVRDTKKSPMERFIPVYQAKRYASKDLWRHLYCHFESTDLFPSIVPCPLSICTSDGITATCDHISIPVSDLAQHFLEAHGWDLQQGRKVRDHEKGIDSDRKKARLERKMRAKDDLGEDGREQANQRVILGNIDPNTQICPRNPARKKPRLR
jgi:hypothetical protein